MAVWVILIAGGLYTSRFLTRGWIPHDEGTIAQSADRVIAGEIPHRDFDEVYTGGLTYLHAAAMRALGVNLRAPRILLFIGFLAFLAAAIAIARRTSTPGAALVVAGLVVVWSVPNYFASLPSWYVLFLATFGTLALLQYLEQRRRLWLVVAGVCGGLSVLLKISGVFYLAGALVWLLFVADRSRISASRSAAGVPLVIGLGVAGYMLSQPALAAHVQYLLPVLVIAGFIAFAPRGPQLAPSTSFSGVGPGLLFLAGAVAPIAIFAGYFWWHGALGSLVQGVFVLPQRRLTAAAMAPPSLLTFGLVAPYAALLLGGRRPSVARGWTPAVAVATALAAALLCMPNPVVYRTVWTAVRWLPLVTAIAAVALLARSEATQDSSPTERLRGQRIWLLATMTAFVSLIQIPYATPIYFCYAAPMTMLALSAVISAQPFAPMRLHTCIGAFLLLFAVLFVNRSHGSDLGVRFSPYDAASRLALPRAGLLVPERDRQTYDALIRRVEQLAAGGTIFAGPDCPEVYFLAGLRNPTRAIFDVLGAAPVDAEALSQLLDRAPIRAAVINTAPLFSPPLDSAIVTLLERRFSKAEQFGRFVLRYD